MNTEGGESRIDICSQVLTAGFATAVKTYGVTTREWGRVIIIFGVSGTALFCPLLYPIGLGTPLRA